MVDEAEYPRAILAASVAEDRLDRDRGPLQLVFDRRGTIFVLDADADERADLAPHQFDGFGERHILELGAVDRQDHVARFQPRLICRRADERAQNGEAASLLVDL